MYFYSKQIPSNADIVIGKITNFTDSGTYCELVEYNNIEGFILNTELDRKVFNPKKQFTIGSIYPFCVLNTVDNKIDLSYRKVNKNDRKEYIDKYFTASKICKIVDEMILFTKLDRQLIYETIVHKLFDKYQDEDIINLYHNIMQNPDILTDDIPDDYNDIVSNYITDFKKRIKVTDIVISQPFTLMVLGNNAIDKLKTALSYISDNDVEVKYISSPKYELIVTCKKQSECDTKIACFIDHVDKSMKQIEKNTNYVLKLGDRKILRDKEYHIKFNKEI